MVDAIVVNAENRERNSRLNIAHSLHMIPLIEVNIIIKDKNVVEWRSCQLKCIIPLICSYKQLSTCSVLSSSCVSFDVHSVLNAQCFWSHMGARARARATLVHSVRECEKWSQMQTNDYARFWPIQMKNHFELRWLRCIYWYCCGFC